MWYLKLLAQAGVMQEASEFGSDGGGQGGEGGEDNSLPPEDQGQKAASKNRGWDFSDEVQDAMSYDPFAPKDEGEDDEQGAQKSDEEQEGAENTEGKQGEEGEKEEGAQKEGTGDDELKEQLKQAQTVIDQYKTLFEQQQQQAQTQQAEGEGKKEEDKGKEIPNYPVFNIPDPIKEMLFSDDPNKLTQGLGMMLQGVAQVTHMRVRQEMEERFKNFADNEVPAKQRQLTEEEKAKDTQKQIRKDWVENYPDLAGEELKPLVAQVATMVSQEMNAKEWNEDLHKAIAARVRKILGRSNELPEKKEEAPKKKVPFSSAGTNRQGAPSKVNPQLADISDTLGL